MKKSLLFIFLSFFVGYTVFSQCSINQYIQDNYEFDVKLLALRDILDDPTDPDHLNPFIPQARFIPYLEKLSAIYENPNNEPAIDALFQFFDIHVNQEYNYSIELNTIAFSVDTNVSWVEDFKNTGVSGVAELDQIITDYQFQLDHFWDLTTCSCTIFFIETDIEFLNLNAIIGDFDGIQDLNSAEIYHNNIDMRFNYTGIPYQLENEPVMVSDILIEDDIFSFCIYSGDCFAGCLYSRCWNIQVSEDCEVSLLSSPENELSSFSIYPNPTPEQLFIVNGFSETEAIHIYSMEGKLMISEASNTEEIDVSSLPSGIYFIEISNSEGQKHVQKFIKQ
jgi:hypothetical protein